MVVEGQITPSNTAQRAHSAVREVPNFKQLHKQWERRLERVSVCPLVLVLHCSSC